MVADGAASWPVDAAVIGVIIHPILVLNAALGDAHEARAERGSRATTTGHPADGGRCMTVPKSSDPSWISS